MTTSSNCHDDLKDDLTSYCLVFGTIFAWNVFCMVLYHCLLHDNMQGAPALQSQFFSVLGVLQLIAVSLSYLFVIPTCPDSCNCRPLRVLGVVPLLECLLGWYWLVVAYYRGKRAEQVQGGGGGGGDVFTKLPADAEMELTERSDDDNAD